MKPKLPAILVVLAALSAPAARADAVTDWNERSCDAVVAAGLPAQPANRIMAIAHTAALQAAEGVASDGAVQDKRVAMEAAIAAAHRTALLKLLPVQQPLIDGAYQAAMAALPDGAAKTAGTRAGDQAVATLIAQREDDGAATQEAYRPFTTPGRYVPTTVPAVPQWSQRRPWVMPSGNAFRPGPPPPLASERWARDFNETRTLGARTSSQRSAEQTEIARFWETTVPPIYHMLARGLAQQPGRDLLRNARLFVALTQGMDDAMIAVFDAKYHHAAWRPITAIRNADQDGNAATPQDPSWQPLLATPMHPEYPCAHCVQSGVVAAVLQAEMARGAATPLRTRSASANGAERGWATLDDFVREVGNARVYGGMHFRFSTEAGAELGRRIGALAAARHLGD
ncbi:hypothetical protein J2X16_000983 [Pelomonas aquatica]|uniref:PA-phosphatase n=1 Tax=Pelomonas aquatica TaxID=431058 RepID=A0ABU1Z4X1_9BURK|nr:vanadium-dependent haloperoxidase [Pelomonas aquatica]MDR7295662.1 hypothetical protein [Pelomonas aquatica]